MKTTILSLCLIIASSLVRAGQDPAQLGILLAKQYPAMKAGETAIVLIYFTDKGDARGISQSDAPTLLSERAINRRMKYRSPDRIIDAADLPLYQPYVRGAAARVTAVRHELKWFNALSAVATREQIGELRTLPFVREIELVGRWRKNHSVPETLEPLKETLAPGPAPSGTSSLDYGTSFTQLNQLKVPAVHDKGIYGQGVVVGVFDNGFRLLTHEAFASMNIIATYDFVDHKVSVVPNNPSTSFGSHGVTTLSTIGGYKPGQLIGPTFMSQFILARTENDSSETPVEEDNWAKAIQWADSIGVDVTSTSLGYLTYDAPYTSWTWQDMNGNTTLITKAADRAVSLGIVVVNSAGNEGGGDGIHNTLIAPADGDSVITAGAVDASGSRVSFSSVGPTTDIPARIKPDIMAMGSGVKVASSTNPTGYGSASGTSYSCPLSAGVAALIRCANPALTPMQVREAMRMTASNAAAPNNLMGWGILNADSAIGYYGALPQGHLAGRVYHDVNGNGMWDAGEPFSAGVWVYVTGAVAESTQTDGLGNYSFASLPMGSVTVSEKLPPGWMQTNPPGNYSLTLGFRADTAGLDFGTFQQGTIRGTVFYDINKDGQFDVGDSTLSGWVVHLAGPVSGRAVSDSMGRFAYTGLGAGSYVLTESLQGRWQQTVPPGGSVYTVSLTSGLDTACAFGNYIFPGSTYGVVTGWNMLSLPSTVSDPRKTVLYPSATSDAFIYDSGYKSLDSIRNGVGYWLKFSSVQTISLTGDPRTSDTASVHQGWNLIGTPSSPVAVSGIVQIPDSNVLSQYIGYPYGGGHDTLQPHFGYWVKVKSAGILILNSGPGKYYRSMSLSLMDLLSGMNAVTVRDALGREGRLYFGRSEDLQRNISAFEMPPLPPADAFDVRFAGGFMAWVPPPGEGSIPIRITGAATPVEISWKMSGGSADYLLAAGEGTVPIQTLTGNGNLLLQAEQVPTLSLRSGGAPLAAVPSVFRLEQNYPNPFNPVTQIRYQLPSDARVRLTAYNMFGEEVQTLVSGLEEAGYHSAEFPGNAASLPSGVYLYKLTAVSTLAPFTVWTGQNKMILLK
jgi:serine protease AprX